MIRFNIMNSVNDLTGFSRFQLHMGRSPRIIPPLIDVNEDDGDCGQLLDVRDFLKKMDLNTEQAKDSLFMAKVQQASHTNKNRNKNESFEIGERVMLSMLHRRREYKSKDKKCVAKFMPCFDGPYVIIDANPTLSSYTLEMPNNPGIFPTFHISELKRFTENDATLFPSRENAKPGPIMGPSGEEE
jgi:hypothetical protein